MKWLHTSGSASIMHTGSSNTEPSTASGIALSTHAAWMVPNEWPTSVARLWPCVCSMVPTAPTTFLRDVISLTSRVLMQGTSSTHVACRR